QAMRRAVLHMPPGEAIRTSIEALDLDRVLAALPRAAARLGNLDRLVAIARTQGGTLASFVRWLERRIREQTDEAEAAVFSPEDDAVRLTTNHASKGLDFPVVVLVDLNAEPHAASPGLALGRTDVPPKGPVASNDNSPAPRMEGQATLLVRHFAWERAPV